MLQDVTNTLDTDTCENSQTDVNFDLKCKIEEALGPISKLPSHEVLECIRNLKVQYLATSEDPSMAHAGRKSKSWILNYPALACMLNGGLLRRLCWYVGHHGVTCDASQNMGEVGKLGGYAC